MGSNSDRDPSPGVGAHGGARPRRSCVKETALDTVRWRAGSKRAAYSRVAPARSDVRSASERSSLPKTRRLGIAEIGGQVARRRRLQSRPLKVQLACKVCTDARDCAYQFAIAANRTSLYALLYGNITRGRFGDVLMPPSRNSTYRS